MTQLAASIAAGLAGVGIFLLASLVGIQKAETMADQMRSLLLVLSIPLSVWTMEWVARLLAMY